MADNDHTKDSCDSGSRTSEYEKLKQYIIDIENESKTEWSIYKVPCTLRNLKPEAYTPQLVSIGPIHHNLNLMQEQKLRYVKLFWSRVKNKTEEMDKFKKFLEDEEKNIRKCYAENLTDNFEAEKLVMMMLLDSVFIMELFLRIQRQGSDEEESKNDNNEKKQKGSDEEESKNNNEKKQTCSDDIIVKQSWLNKSIQRDLLLLENQIPLFILEKLYKTFVPDSDATKKKHPTFIELARDYFVCYQTDSSSGEKTGSSDSKSEPPDEEKKCGTNKKSDSSSGEKTGSSDSQVEPPKHFTDLIRSFYICKDPHPCEQGSPLRTATKLRESGVSFEKVNHKPLLDIKFKKLPILSYFLCFGCFPKSSYFKARLRIPQLKVEDTTECVLRNLIAFEQCHYPDQPYICNYVSFIDSLIHTKDDVELLVEKEVIVHELGSDKEVATLVNGLCKHVVTNKTCYRDIIDDLNEHYQSQWNRTMAALRLVYFRDAWRASSTLVAIAVLVFTIFNFCRVVRLVLDLEGGNKEP